MSKPRRKKAKLSVRDDPVTSQKNSLVGVVTGSELSLSDDDRARVFMSNYLEVVRPISTYPETFDDSDSTDTTLAVLRNMFIAKVLKSGWSERKFVEVVDVIWSNGNVLSKVNIEKAGRVYDYMSGGE